jgi:hypothetical protein
VAGAGQLVRGGDADHAGAEHEHPHGAIRSTAGATRVREGQEAVRRSGSVVIRLGHHRRGRRFCTRPWTAHPG